MTSTTKAYGNRRAARASYAAGRVAALSLSLLFLAPPVARAADGPGQPGRQVSDKDKLRQKWENLITFWGEEETNLWSLRVPDKFNPEPANVKYRELWKYDPDTNKWVKVDDTAKTVRIVNVKDKPDNSPVDSQLIVDFPIPAGTVGLYYAKWTVYDAANNAIEGTSFCRIGPGLTSAQLKAAAANPQKVDKGQMVTIVPLSVTKSEMRVIPDPQFGTGQALTHVPATKPASPK